MNHPRMISGIDKDCSAIGDRRAQKNSIVNHYFKATLSSLREEISTIWRLGAMLDLSSMAIPIVASAEIFSPMVIMNFFSIDFRIKPFIAEE
jgi:hypothetical protein